MRGRRGGYDSVYDCGDAGLPRRRGSVRKTPDLEAADGEHMTRPTGSDGRPLSPLR
jgi:hypothetical protein